MARRKKLADRIDNWSQFGFQPRQGGSNRVRAKAPNAKPVMEMPGSRAPAQPKATGPVQARIQWSAPKKNTTGNARSGSMYREGVDPKTGAKYTLYEAQAGGVPRQVFQARPGSSLRQTQRLKDRLRKPRKGSRVR